MKYEAIFFDLDGTLLPMDYDEFTKGYLKMLTKAVSPYGYTAETLIPAMWKGVGSMVKNDGTVSNYNRFWDTFAVIIGDHVYNDIPKFDEFYTNDFHKAIMFTKPTELAKKAVALAREKAIRVVLATNPLFPRVAVDARLSWAGLTSSDFDHITDYENSTCCKPNPAYYLEIAEKIGVDPNKCLMIGNNTEEDIFAAQKAGLSAFLLTDCLIHESDKMPNVPNGSFEELIDFLEKI